MKTVCSVLLTIALTGCAATEAARTKLVLDRAVFDLQCDASELQASELGGDVYGVTGCGRRAAYVLDGGAQEYCRKSLAPMTVRKYCTAVLNSAGEEATEAEPRPE